MKNLENVASELVTELNSGSDDGCVLSILEDAFPECIDDNDWPIVFQDADGVELEGIESFYDAAVIIIRHQGAEARVTQHEGTWAIDSSGSD